MNIQLVYRRANRVTEIFRKFFPFTLPGTVIVISSFYLLGFSYGVKNPYGYLLSISALLLSLILVIGGRIQGARLNMNEVSWNTSNTIFSTKSTTRHTHGMEINGFSTFPFFRLHVEISGTLKNGKKSLLYSFKNFSSPVLAAGTIIPTPLDIPLSGEFYVTARLVIKDFFGLTRAEALEVHKRQIPVLPGLLSTGIKYHSATQGSEEQTKMRSSDIERYYMRDYVPGDRFRDINWKASSRGEKLYTRISPVAEEKTRILTVWVRIHDHFDHMRLNSVLHADLIKSWVMTFLTLVRSEHPDYSFRIIAAGEEFELDAEDEFTSFAAFLANIPCTKAPPRSDELIEYGITEGNVYLFASGFDPGLTAIERTYPDIIFHRHLSMPVKAQSPGKLNEKQLLKQTETKTDKSSGNNNPKSDVINMALLPDFTGKEWPFLWILDPRPVISGIRNAGNRFRLVTSFTGGTTSIMYINTAVFGTE